MCNFLLQLFLGVVILLISTKVMVKVAEKLSSSLKISPLFIGITIVALGTSLPELAVSSIASARNDIGLAMGNIVGSNIVNILMVLPVGILIGKLRIGTTKTQRNVTILLLVTAIFIASHLIPIGNTILGLIFITLAILLTIAEYKWAVFGRKHEDLSRMNHLKKERFTLGKLVMLAISVIGIIAGGYLTVTSIESISTITGYSTTVLGLSLTAIVTSLPELLTTIFSQEEHQEKLTIGNIIGSNIYNLLFIGGIINLFSPVTYIEPKNLVILAITTIFFFLIIRHYGGQKIPRWISVFLFLLLGSYLYYLGISK